MDEPQFQQLLTRTESDTLDFKSRQYDLSRGGGLDLVKDITCFANTPRESAAHIVLGVEKRVTTGETVLHGLDADIDEAEIQRQLADRVSPIPRVTYEVIRSGEKQFGVISVHPDRIGPCIPLKDFPPRGTFLRARQIYFRRGSTNDIATPEDIRRILDWLSGGAGVATAADAAWMSFLQAVQNFHTSHRFILINGCTNPDQLSSSAGLGLVPWVAVFDFDPDSEATGLLKYARPNLEKTRSIHLVTKRERPTLNVVRGTYWFFARGLAGADGPAAIGPWLGWKQQYGRALSEQMGSLASALLPDPVTIVVLLTDSTLTQHVRSALDAAIDAFGEAVTFVLVSGDIVQVQSIADTFGATALAIPIYQLSSGLEESLGRSTTSAESSAYLPSSSGAPVLIDTDRRAWLAEELEVVDIAIGQTADHPDSGRQFLLGGEVSWHELNLHYDVDRDKTPKLAQRLRSDLRDRAASRVNLYHAPGAGGTTVGKRILWQFHEELPCALLLRTRPLETVDRLAYIIGLTQQPLLLMIDGSRTAEAEVDDLFEVIRARHLPVVLLQVLRRFGQQEERLRTFYLSSELSVSEAGRLSHVLKRERTRRSPEIDKVASSQNAKLRTAFFMGLVAFEDDFQSLPSYVGARIAELTEPQLTILLYLALSYHYAQQSLPAASFADILGVDQSRGVDLERAMPSAALDVILEDADGWRPTHDLVALELIQQIVVTGVADRRTWRQFIASRAKEFAWLCRGAGPAESTILLDVARRTFVYRDNAELLGTERSGSTRFAQIIEDIPSSEGALEVLKCLVEAFPEEPHFWAHLGRFYSIRLKYHDDAARCVDRAIALTPDDALLRHIQGMVLRQKVYARIEARESIESIVPDAISASDAFASSRELNPDNEHGYISDVQLITRLLEYLNASVSGGIAEYVRAPNASAYLREGIDRAENLLDLVRRRREGEHPSPYEEDCRAKLNSVRGRHDQALQTWDSLLRRQDVYRPPLRRQIVWTYLARANRSWRTMSPKDIKRSVELLEANLIEEPNDDRNLRLWLQGVRHVVSPPSIESVIEQVAYWKANASSLDATYYLYVLYSLLALTGFRSAADMACRYVEECRTLTRFRRNRSVSFEWFGNGEGVTQLVHQSRLGDWNRDAQFWSNADLLKRAQGRITRIVDPGSGVITLSGDLTAFFVPGKGRFERGRAENTLVEFFIGFSYEGPRAWEVRAVT